MITTRMDNANRSVRMPMILCPRNTARQEKRSEASSVLTPVKSDHRKGSGHANLQWHPDASLRSPAIIQLDLNCLGRSVKWRGPDSVYRATKISGIIATCLLFHLILCV